MVLFSVVIAEKRKKYDQSGRVSPCTILTLIPKYLKFSLCTDSNMQLLTLFVCICHLNIKKLLKWYGPGPSTLCPCGLSSISIQQCSLSREDQHLALLTRHQPPQQRRGEVLSTQQILYCETILQEYLITQFAPNQS